jgi:D-glycero-beta-D-manno-heptose 1-phosphate adenylyltransferase
MKYHQQLRSKIADRKTAASIIRALKNDSKKIVFTNGCFDILHPGHVDYLAQARDLGDFLIVGLNTDASVRTLQKSPERPVNSEAARAIVLAGLASVDMIVHFDEQTPLQLIGELLPDVLVKGDDYKPDQIVGADIVTANGGSVVTVPLVKGYSTTAIIQKLRA